MDEVNDFDNAFLLIWSLLGANAIAIWMVYSLIILEHFDWILVGQ